MRTTKKVWLRTGAVACLLGLGWTTGCRDSNEGEGTGPVHDVVMAGSDQGSPAKRGYAGESAAFGTVNTTGGLISGNVSGRVPLAGDEKFVSGGAGSMGLENEVTSDQIYGNELGRPGYGAPGSIGGSGTEGGPPSPTGVMGPARTGGVRGVGGQPGGATGTPGGSESVGPSMLEKEEEAGVDTQVPPADQRPIVPRTRR